MSFQTKKKNANFGRWFYTCPNSKKKQCDFFLWKDDAVAREQGTVVSNLHAEVTHSIGRDPLDGSSTAGPSLADTRWSTTAQQPVSRRLFTMPAKANGDDTGDELAAAIRADASASRPVKRKRVEFQLDEDSETGSTTDLGGFDSEEERELVRLADSSQRVNQTSRRSDGEPSRNGLSTPTPRRSHDVVQGIPTPVSEAKSNGAPERRTVKRQRLDDWWGVGPPSSPPSSQGTLTALNNTTAPLDSSPTPKRGSQGEAYHDVTQQVLQMIPTGAVSDAVRDKISGYLDLHGLRMAGIEKGRDLAREEVRKKDSDIQMLQARIAALETERRKQEGMIAGLKGGLAGVMGLLDSGSTG